MLKYAFIILALIILTGCATPEQELAQVRGAFIAHLENMIEDKTIWVYEINGEIEEHPNGYLINVYTFKRCKYPDVGFLVYDKSNGNVHLEQKEEFLFTPDGDAILVEHVEYNRCGDSCLLDGKNCDEICAEWESKIIESFFINSACQKLVPTQG